MLTEQYFPDVQFAKLERISPPVEKPKPDILDPELNLPDSGWSFEGTILIYSNTIEQIRQYTGADLAWDNRRISFVKRPQLTSGGQGEAQINRYGSYILDEIAGTCARQPDGSFDIKIVHRGDGHVANAYEVMQLLGHEHGHTLGEEIPDTVLEEVKAIAFEALFMRYFLNVSHFPVDGVFANKVHDVAKNMVNQLVARGFSHEVIIATLTGKPFGPHRPDSNIQIPQS